MIHCGIYALIDPRTERVRYVGQSVDIDCRYRQHVASRYDGNLAKSHWVNELRRLGLVPRLQVLQECDWPESDDVEKNLIREYKVDGQCDLNIAQGGAGAVISRAFNATQEDWFQLGRKVKLARATLIEISTELCTLAGAKYSDQWQAPIKSLDKCKSKLENLIASMFPEWAELIHVFYGPDKKAGDFSNLMSGEEML